jgi:D-alanine-D-alanine ligase
VSAYEAALAWFRRDLRVDDNARLHQAARACGRLHCAFVFDRAILDGLRRRDRRVEFIHASVGTDAIAERYVDGRELYVGVLGNDRVRVFPPWEMHFQKMIEGDNWPIATERVKWNSTYQKKHGISTDEARDLPPGSAEHIERLARRIYRTLDLTGYARIDLRLDTTGRVYFIEANPNPQLAYGEDFAESAERAGLSYEALLERILALGLAWRPGAT